MVVHVHKIDVCIVTLSFNMYVQYLEKIFLTNKLLLAYYYDQL